MTSQSMNPVAGERANGVRRALLSGRPSNHSTAGKTNKFILTVRILPNGDPIKFTGRAAQTLALLIRVGSAGFTSGEASPLGWARRTSAYVAELRKMGFPILTVWEPVGDARVGRYVLACQVEVVGKDAKTE